MGVPPSAAPALHPPAPQESLASLRQQCTTIIVAHRLSTVADANAIVVFDGGSIVEAGSHAELLQRGGLYATMWQRQQEGTPLGSFSQQSEAAQLAAAEAAAGAAAGGRADAYGLSRTTSHTTVDAEEEDEEDAEEEEERQAGRLEGIEEQAEEALQHASPRQ